MRSPKPSVTGPDRRRGIRLSALVLGLLLTVTAAQAAATWRMVETPRFTVISQLSERATRAWADQFGQYLGALRERIRVDESLLPPLTLVLFDRDGTFTPYKPLGANGRPAPLAGFFANDQSWAVAGLAGAVEQEETRRIIFHEGTHWYTAAIPVDSPVWFEEGIAEVYSTFTVTDRDQRWGAPIEYHLEFLQREASLPVSRLISIGRDDPLFNEELRGGMFYAKSWLLAHYLLFGERTGGRNLLADYFAAASRGPVTAQVFQQVFGTDYDGMDRRLAAYIESGRYSISVRPLPSRSAPTPVTLAPPLRVQAALGRLAIASGRADKAIEHAQAAIALAESDPIGYELLARARNLKGDADGTIFAIEEAEKRESIDAWIRFALATLDLHETVNPNARSARTPTPAEVRSATQHLRRAVEHAALFKQAYLVLAEIIEVAGGGTPADRAALAAGFRHFPHEPAIALGLALASEAAGDHAEALRLARRVTTASPAPDARLLSRARAAVARLERTASPASAPSN